MSDKRNGNRFVNRIVAALAISLVAVFLTSCEEQTPPETTTSEYRVEVKVTSFGIPHITADNFGSLGFGEGYMAAKDHVCNIAYSIVEARGERAKYYGAENEKGGKSNHLMSDIIIGALGIPQNAAQDFAAQTEENQEWVTGFVDGYNKYIREVGRDNITSWCKGAQWVREISPKDLYSRFQLLAQTTPYMAAMITAAAPPKEEDIAPSSAVEIEDRIYGEIADRVGKSQMGSNGWAFGRDRTENGRGMLLGNPHYPWTGTNRFWEKHLTIPGKMDIYGVHLIGAPGVSIGFNRDVGWTHTVSNSERVIFYKLDLVPGDPTSYYYDGKARKMTSKTMDIPVKGTEATQQHTVWFSHYGPMVSLPGAQWTDKQAITLRDANEDNKNLLDQWKDMALARHMDALKEAHRKWNALPWINTIATSRDGRAVYIDGSNVGRLSEDAIALWRDRATSDPLTKTFYQKMDLILLDGSDSRFEWQPHPDARTPGVVPFVEQPQQDRTDYIFNANDSHWLTNRDAPLRGYSPLYGAEDTVRSLRTRMNALMVSDLSADGPAGADGKMSLPEMQQLIFSNRSLSAELLLAELVAACQARKTGPVGDQVIDLSEACVVLKDYDKRLDLDSKGAVLFREWITRYDYRETQKKGTLFKVAFDANDPVNTPRGLADKDIALQKLGEAVQIMTQAGLPLDSPLGAVQFAYRGEEKIAVHGGNNAEGIANIIDQRPYYTLARQITGQKIADSKYLTDKGYAITGGTSFLFSLSYTDEGPKAEAFLTYGQSGDAISPHYTDQTKLFSRKQWRAVRFSRADIDKDVKASFVLTGSRSSGQ